MEVDEQGRELLPAYLLRPLMHGEAASEVFNITNQRPALHAGLCGAHAIPRHDCDRAEKAAPTFSVAIPVEVKMV